ncbi:MAG TPA: hypothetical protein PK668_26135 [Myxococcota bacterium]|nr:hypothetical protein [Myxococcota bacterium]HRY97006.1 hypothetical protein [Myxococcota bacterium]HSA21250.1 hypothetical protein [Myxococcota bacterium]
MRWLLVLALGLLPCAARAAEPLEQAEQLLIAMEYGKALKLAEAVLREPGSGPGELVAALRMQGLCLTALGREAEAVEVFRRLLAIEPAFRLGEDLSPKMRSGFTTALGLSVDQPPLRVSHVPPVVSGALRELRLVARLEADPLRMVKGLRLRYRTAGGLRELSVLVDGPKGVAFKLPERYLADEFTYWFEAFNEHGGVLARVGSPEAPLELRAVPAPPVVAPAPVAAPPPPALEPEEPGRWYASWWFWTVVGVVVAGAVTGGVLGATLDTGPDPLHWDVDVR